MDKFDLLQKTAEVIQDRGEDYGSIVDNHTRISRLWSVLLDTDVTPEQVALCMIAVKQARLMETPDHTDCLLYTSPSPRDGLLSRMPSSA